MLYMLLSGFLMVLGMVQAVRLLVKGEAGSAVNRLLLFSAYILPVLAAAPFVAAFLSLDSGRSVAQMNLISVGSQWVGATAALLLIGVHLQLARKAPKKFLNTGAAVAAAVMAFIYANSLIFISDSNTGLVASFILGDGGSNDVQCERDVLLIHYNKGGKSDWRCPKSIMLMGDTARPFIPWPDYHQGSSRHLTAAIDVLMQNAGRGKADDR